MIWRRFVAYRIGLMVVTTVVVGAVPLTLLAAPPSRKADAPAKSSGKAPSPQRRPSPANLGEADVKSTTRRTFNTRFYVVTTDLDDKQRAQDIGRHMDAVYAEYAARMAGFRPNPYAAVKPGERMPLYVIRRYDDYVALVQSFGFNARNSGGVFFRSQRGSGLATWVEGQSRLKMYHVLQHEGFHQFADARIASNLPQWANEGLAEYFGDALMMKGRLRPGKVDRARLMRVQRAVDDGAVLSFKDLMMMDSGQWMERVTSGDEAASLMYDVSWSVCHSLVHGGPKYLAALEQYLTLLNRGSDARQAFDRVFGDNLEGFQQAWENGLGRVEPDPWFTSVRLLQTLAGALKLFHEKDIAIESFAHLKEQMVRYKFRLAGPKRDAAARGPDKAKAQEAELVIEFPMPAVAEWVPSLDPKLPHGLVVKGIKPLLRLRWRLDDEGKPVEEIDYDGK